MRSSLAQTRAGYAALAAVLCTCACAPFARAFERVNLRNGFSYDCSRHEVLDSLHVRLYLVTDPTTPSANYIDLPANAIADTETLPDPPHRPAAPGVAANATAAAPPTAGTVAPDLRTLLTHAGSVHDIDVELLASIVHAESNGRVAAVSRVGAVGLMQLMPATAAALGVADALRPEGNVAGGTAYLDGLLRRYHDNLALALAAYNAGPATVDRYHGIPPFRETRAYVARVMSEFKRRKLALPQTARNEQH